MKNYIKYADSQYFNYLGRFSVIIGLVAVIPFDNQYKNIITKIIIVIFISAFLIPFIEGLLKTNFKLKTIGKSNISFKFKDLFEEECFVITTDLYFDVDPNSEWIASDSILGLYINKYFHNDITQLESLINAKLRSRNEPHEYGETIKINHDNKLVYLLAFTDRNKADQPSNFYEKALQGFFEHIVNENHGKTIAIPLIGGNNNISDTGFNNLEMTFKSLMTMINCFEIRHLNSEIKLNIVTLPKNRAELMNIVQSYSH